MNFLAFFCFVALWFLENQSMNVRQRIFLIRHHPSHFLIHLQLLDAAITCYCWFTELGSRLLIMLSSENKTASVWFLLGLVFLAGLDLAPSLLLLLALPEHGELPGLGSGDQEPGGGEHGAGDEARGALEQGARLHLLVADLTESDTAATRTRGSSHQGQSSLLVTP